MKRERRNFDKEFKMMVVNLVSSGKPTKEVAEELGIKPDLVRRWRREHEQYQEGSFSGQGNTNMTDEQKEIARLRKALLDAQEERDILKKAVSIFSKNDGKFSSS
ncbi:transposase [Reichenbachiella agarivorans]|uniref:Transposase n=1 Tax=Reichenbachiella agarivorans TaxID=2979464 RepID=A0ABY6CJK1_9BACT|nr:transposase [Reichenbachiella agarivorans]UXP30693.1 transposase [Reichenbachiella agarivorans]UXP32023.1 transposase [Reichenbachiella agarivorans]UXP33049.1 transposase [Reichenbachiella agarivorans]UXP33671.1 transposase [Reichenbachiella agarivorans]